MKGLKEGIGFVPIENYRVLDRYDEDGVCRWKDPSVGLKVNKRANRKYRSKAIDVNEGIRVRLTNKKKKKSKKPSPRVKKSQEEPRRTKG